MTFVTLVKKTGTAREVFHDSILSSGEKRLSDAEHPAEEKTNHSGTEVVVSAGE